MKDPILRRLVYLCAALNLLIAGAYLLFIPEPWPWVKGQILGGAVSILLFFQMEMTLRRALPQGPQLANRKVRLAYGLRLLIYAAVAVLAMREPSVHLIAVLVGIVSMKYTVLVSSFLKWTEKSEGGE